MKLLELHFIGKMLFLIPGDQSPLAECQSIEGRAGLNSDDGDVIVSAALWSDRGGAYKLCRLGRIRGTELRAPRHITKSEIWVFPDMLALFFVNKYFSAKSCRGGE